MKSILITIIFLVTFNTLSSQNTDDTHPILTSRFMIGAGWYFPTRDVKLSVAGTINTDGIEEIEDIDIDETLGLSSGDDTFTLSFFWRFSKSKLWSVRGDYFKLGATRTVVLDEEIKWEGVTYPVGGEVEGSFGIGLYRVFFGRAITAGQKHELGVGIGSHGLDVSASIEGEGFVGDEPVGINKSDVGVFLPLPNIGFWFIWAPSYRWAFSASVDWFGISIDNISGSLWNVSPGITFQIFKNLGINANYQFLSFNADVDRSDFRGSFDLTFGGPSFRIIGNF